MNPLYRTEYACTVNNGSLMKGDEGYIDPEAVLMEMASQEKFAPAFLLNLSVGKSWYIQRKYNIGFSLEGKNLTNNRNVKTGGYEQTRLYSNSERTRYYKFDPKYFYMQGVSYMLNIYFRF